MKSMGFNQERDLAAKRKRGGKRGNKQRILSGKQSPVKMHPNHTVTDHGIEIGGLRNAPYAPDENVPGITMAPFCICNGDDTSGCPFHGKEKPNV